MGGFVTIKCPNAKKLNLSYFSLLMIFLKKRLGLNLTHKRITIKVVLPVPKGKGVIQGEVKKCVKRGKLRC